jgi:hypothetical protein
MRVRLIHAAIHRRTARASRIFCPLDKFDLPAHAGGIGLDPLAQPDVSDAGPVDD